MLKQIKAWLTQRRQQRAEQAYKVGYVWAMNTLHSNGDEELTPEQIFDRCNDSFDGPNPFDRGAIQAVYDFEESSVKEPS